METGFCLLVLMVLMPLPPAWLYSLHNCTLDMDEPRKVCCSYNWFSIIPLEIPKSTVFLEVVYNDVMRISRRDFSDLNELQTLDLSLNLISHIEDAAFSGLPGLTELSLRRNLITNLTNGMFQGLCNLTVLDLGLNKITHIPESVFAPLKKLQVLRLSSNRLSSARDIVNAVSFSPLLNMLDLAYNIFTSLESEDFPFPLNITELFLGSNPLSSFTLHSDMFPHLQTLDFSIRCEIKWNISDKAFFKSLRTLILTKTNFTSETYKLIFHSVDLVEKLILRNVSHLDKGLLNWACGIQSLLSLDLTRIFIPLLDESLLQSCSQLTKLVLLDNSLTYLSPSALRMLTRLSELSVSYNHLTRVPLTIRNMSSLRSLSLYNNRITKLDCLDFSHLQLLTELDLSHNNLVEINSCVFRDLHSLKELHVSQNPFFQFDDSFGTSLPNLLVLKAFGSNIVKLQKGVFTNMRSMIDLELDSQTGTEVALGAWDGLTNLRTLSYSPLSSTLRPNFNLPLLENLHFPDSYSTCLDWDTDSLKGLKNLKVFKTGQPFCVSRSEKVFSFTPHLLTLTMKGNKYPFPYPELFLSIPALQTLDLSENHLTSVDFLLEANLTQLQKLVLKENDLSVINQKVFEALPSLQYLDLSDNPFACNCSNADFIHWAIFNRQVYVHTAFQYRCASPPSHEGLILLDFDFRWCWEYTSFFCFVTSSALVLLTLLCSFIHHFLRFQLLFTFYLLRAFLYHRQKQRRGCAQVYDAFVSYNVHDEEWVYRELVPELEERQGWRLCLHHRDFQPGKAILENITDAIYSSRKTLCVISQHYLHSEWCSREVQMASFRLLDEKKDVLVLLFLEELSSNQLSPFFRMRKLLRRRTYVSWNGARGHRGLFWERVRHALQSGELPAEGPLPPDD